MDAQDTRCEYTHPHAIRLWNVGYRDGKEGRPLDELKRYEKLGAAYVAGHVTGVLDALQAVKND